MAALYDNYRGHSLLDYIQYEKDLAMIWMTEKEHPDKLWERLFAVWKKYCDNKLLGIKMEHLIARAVNEASATYQKHFILEMAKWPLGKDPYLLIEELTKTGHALHIVMVKNKTNESELLEETEVGLFAMEDPSKARKKWEKESKTEKSQDGDDRNTYTFKGKCHLCNMKGHRRADCYELKVNAKKRPVGWKSRL